MIGKIFKFTLKSCPKCGKSGFILYRNGNITRGHAIKCYYCGHIGPYRFTHLTAGFAWGIDWKKTLKGRERMTELKPCPLCGHSMKLERIQWAWKTTVRIKHADMSAKLYVCNLSYAAEYDNEIAERCIVHFIERWNRRV